MKRASHITPFDRRCMAFFAALSVTTLACIAVVVMGVDRALAEIEGCSL